MQVHPREFSLEGFPFYFSVAIYCFEGAGMILSLEESLAAEVTELILNDFISGIFWRLININITFQL